MKHARDTMPMALFGARLKTLRKQSGLTQQEVANQLRLDRTTYTKYETGRISPDQQSLVALAQIFAVSVDHLLGNDHPDGSTVSDQGENSMTLTEQERMLVQIFRQLSEEERQALTARAQSTYRDRTE